MEGPRLESPQGLSLGSSGAEGRTPPSRMSQRACLPLLLGASSASPSPQFKDPQLLDRHLPGLRVGRRAPAKARSMETRHPLQEELTTAPSSWAASVRVPVPVSPGSSADLCAWVCSRSLWRGFWNQTYMLTMARSLNPPGPQFPHL